MSSSELFTKLIDNFAESLSVGYDINKSDILDLWYKSTSSIPTTTSSTTPKPISVKSDKSSPQVDTKFIASNSELLKLSKNELVEHCKRRNLKTTGTKAEMIERLTGTKSVEEPVKKPAVVKTTTSQKARDKEAVQAEVVKSLFQVKPVSHKIVKNEFGNFWHPETQLVFDRDLKKFYGKQNASGKIDNMTEEDIETCNRYKFAFLMPETLAKSERVAVAELDEDELVGDEEEIVDEEEVEDDVVPLEDE
jgi:hypothetical protein